MTTSDAQISPTATRDPGGEIPAIEVRDLHKSFGDLEVLQGIDFLHRDVVNVCGWFERRGVAVDAEEVFADVLSFL